MKNTLFEPGEKFAELTQALARDLPQEWGSKHKNAVTTRTECASSIGIAVSLIEGMMATARVLCRMDLSPIEVQEGLKDLRDCLELKSLVATWHESSQGRIRLEKKDQDAPVSIEQMKQELIAAGWFQSGRLCWKSPAGALYRGPRGAWKAMKAQRSGIVRPPE